MIFYCNETIELGSKLFQLVWRLLLNYTHVIWLQTKTLQTST